MEKIVTLVGEYGYTRASFSGWGYEDVNIYKFVDENEKVYIWKTTNMLQVEGKEIGGLTPAYETFPPVGSVIRIKFTEKGESVYKGELQTNINRVKCLEIIERGLTEDEKNEIKKQGQLDSLKGEDFIWEMPYRQFKSHYSDCETLAGSFYEAPDGISYITVIVREGRLKNSGVRGEHYYGFKMKNSKGQYVTLRAVKEENALKRVQKLYPEETWECVRVYHYGLY